METEWMNETSAEAPSVPAPEKTEKKKSPTGKAYTFAVLKIWKNLRIVCNEIRRYIIGHRAR